MEKTFKKEFKDILKDEYMEGYEHPLRKRSLKMACLERVINVARIELFYPKLREEYDHGGMTEIHPKGIGYAAIVNLIAGGYMAHIAEGSEDKLYWVMGALGLTALQYFLGTGIRTISESISNKLKK